MVVGTPVQTDCNGNEWELRLYPGGERGAAEQGYIGLFLYSCKTETIEAKFDLAIIDSGGDVCVEKTDNAFYEFSRGQSWGYGSASALYLKLSNILDPANKILQGGALCIDVSIQVKAKNDDMYQPPSPHSANMLKLLKSSKDADVSFIVRGTTVLAHSLIITANAPILANYCNFISEADSGCSSDKLIEDVSPEVFQLILEYIYSGIYPSNKDAIKYDKELINAANKNELVELKMVVENMLVQECVITNENVSDYIVFANSKCCPLLKEYALSYFVLHYKDVLKKEDSKILCESRELLSQIINLVGQSGEESLSVAELRKELGKLDLDVDGSKEALVSRLEGAKRQTTA